MTLVIFCLGQSPKALVKWISNTCVHLLFSLKLATVSKVHYVYVKTKIFTFQQLNFSTQNFQLGIF